ncbi:MucR family transcriptional regulator [Acrocarpospora sp. B8E8]|uniref:MucR family transcriptional regulator n=1 Tax=Acrocarpospora sp. B8E8 TaxID=3153572 RepID=UPI00325ED2CC
MTFELLRARREMGDQQGRPGHWIPPGRPTDVPLGVQPESGGKLLCLECGLWFRQLGQHVVAKHDMSADDYRRVYELPRGFGLHSSAVKQVRAESQRERLAADPEFKARLRPKRSREELARLSKIAWYESKDRAGVRAARRQGPPAHNVAQYGHLGTAAMRANRAAEVAELCRAAGFASIEEVFTEKAALSNREIAELMGMSKGRVDKLRRRLGFDAPGRWAKDYVVKHPSMLPPIPAKELAAVPYGTQPVKDGYPLCLECGRWFKRLDQHIAVMHGLNVADYYARHGIDPHEARARELGYASLADLLAATADWNGTDLGKLLGVTTRKTRELRHRHGLTPPRGARPVGFVPKTPRPHPPLSAAELAAVPYGEQPDRDGQLLCLECGEWTRGAGAHVRWKHGIGAAEYRARHGLPADTKLHRRLGASS